MRTEKIRDVIACYEQKLQALAIIPHDYPHEELLKSPEASLEHLASMLPKMRIFLNEGRTNKVYRWLGFIQGALWSQGIYTLEELKNHNKPEA